MMTYTELFKDTYRYALLDVSYRMIENEKEIRTTLKVTDSVKSEMLKDSIHLLYTRRLYHDPESDYEVSVTYKVIIDTKEGIVLDSYSEADIDAVIKGSSKEILTPMASKASAMIAHITEIGQGVPIILPATLVQETSTNTEN